MEKRPFLLLSEDSLGNSFPGPRMRNPGSNRERPYSDIFLESQCFQTESIAMARGSSRTEKKTNTGGMKIRQHHGQTG